MNHLIKAEEKEGLRLVAKRREYGLKLLDFSLLNFPGGGKFAFDTKDEELAAIILTGTCSVTNGKDINWQNIGGRKNVFEAQAYSFYLPIETKCELSAGEGFSLAFVKVAAKKKFKPVLIQPEDIKVTVAGAFNWKREVQKIFDDNLETNHILGGETLNPISNWSSAPPHRHDEDNIPVESDMEEVYYFKLHPPEGFGMQRIYTYDRKVDAAYVLEDGDTTVMSEGYHPVVGGPGYQIHYLWFLAGEKRILCQNDDPDHAWVKKLGEKMAPHEAQIMRGRKGVEHPLLEPYKKLIEDAYKERPQ